MKIKGKIFLSGGGSEKDSYKFDKYFVESLKGRKILYIPIAMDRDAQGYEDCLGWITNSLTQFNNKFVDISMWLDLKGRSLSDLKSFNTIYIGGGNTFRLLDKIYSSGFDKLLKKFIQEGGTYYGGSAGAIITGKSINIAPEENDKNYKHGAGLNLVGKYSFICHYDKETRKKERQIEKFIHSTKSPVIAIPEGAGLVIEKKRIQILGSGKPVTKYDEGGKKEILSIGTSVIISTK